MVENRNEMMFVDVGIFCDDRNSLTRLSGQTRIEA